MKRRRLWAAGVAVALVPLGIGWRMLPLPFFLSKYGGSVLWAAMIYCVVVALLPALRPVGAAIVSGGVAAAVECSRLYHSPALDAFRVTMAGKLMLGRVFSVRNIAAYWLAIGAAALIDWRLRTVSPPE